MNAEGVEMDENSESNGIPKDIVSEMEKTMHNEPAKKTQLPQPQQSQQFNMPSQGQQNMLNMMMTANNLRNSLLQAQVKINGMSSVLFRERAKT